MCLRAPRRAFSEEVAGSEEWETLLEFHNELLGVTVPSWLELRVFQSLTKVQKKKISLA